MSDPVNENTSLTSGAASRRITEQDHEINVLRLPLQSSLGLSPEKDPLEAYINDLPDELRDPERRVSMPIAEKNATTHGARTLADFTILKEREAKGRLRPDEAEYARYRTPITERVEKQLAALDGGEMALVFRSGMAAIEKVIDSVLPTGRGEVGHLIVGTEGYRQTRNVLDRTVKRGWVELSVIPMDQFHQVHEYLRSNTRAVFFETPSNPYLRVIDVAGVKRQLDAANSSALVIVDHTFAGPLNQRPLEQGADLVVPSLTKYIGGNNQLMAGAVIGRKELVLSIHQLRSQGGSIAHDEDCLGIEQGLKTLEERTKRCNHNGLHVANLLVRNPNVSQIWYPGHPSHPDHEIAVRQMSGFGAVVSFRIHARDFHDTAAFTDAFVAAAPEETFIAPSFGSESPLISVVAIVSHFQQSRDERQARGIPDDLIRLSVGSGNPQHLTEALAAGFTALEGRLHRGR